MKNRIGSFINYLSALTWIGFGLTYLFKGSFMPYHSEAVSLQWDEVDKNIQIHFEPGRALVAQCGSLISRVIHVKHGIRTNFVIADAGMTELIRPALYQSFHHIENLTNPNGFAALADAWS